MEARRLQHTCTLAFCLVFKCWVASVANLPDEVRQHSEEMFDLANEHGFPVFLAHATSWRGWWSAAVGQASDGVSLIAKAMQLLRATGSAINIPNYLASQAEAYGKLGQSAEGLSRLGEALQFIEATDERPFEAEVYRLRGDLLTTTGAEEMAEQDYRRALAVAGRQGARTLELRAAISVARLWRDQGKQAEARDLLAPIYGWFTEGFDTPVLQAAKNLLDELRR